MMDHPPSPAGPLQTRARVMMGLLCGGLLLIALGLGLGRAALGAAGLLVAGAGAAGLWIQGQALLQAAWGRQDLLQDLNRNLDEQVGQRTQRLMKIIEDLESFNRMVTHDLKSPLSGLILGLEMLRDQMVGEPDERKQDLVKGISGSAKRMQELIHDLQQLALTSGRITIIQAVDLSQYASLVLLTLRERDPDRRVTWRIEPGLVVHGDPSLIRIALENLLGNAWKFTAGRESPEISVQRGAGEDMVIEISDNGCGFDPAKADRLFQPFFRVHDDPKYPGSGLGLSIVKRVMTRHGGHVSASSIPGKGTTFRLAFPMGYELH